MQAGGQGRKDDPRLAEKVGGGRIVCGCLQKGPLTSLLFVRTQPMFWFMRKIKIGPFGVQNAPCLTALRACLPNHSPHPSKSSKGQVHDYLFIYLIILGEAALG